MAAYETLEAVTTSKCGHLDGIFIIHTVLGSELKGIMRIATREPSKRDALYYFIRKEGIILRERGAISATSQEQNRTRRSVLRDIRPTGSDV